MYAKGRYIEQNIPRAHPRYDISYPPYYTAVAKVVTDWSLYKYVIKSCVDVIVVNTHGEVLRKQDSVPRHYASDG